MKMSAILKTGQNCRSMKSITQPKYKRSIMLEIAPDIISIKYKVLCIMYFLYKIATKKTIMVTQKIQNIISEICNPKAIFLLQI